MRTPCPVLPFRSWRALSSPSPTAASTAPPAISTSTRGARSPARSSPMAIPTTPARACAPTWPPTRPRPSSATALAPSPPRPSPTAKRAQIGGVTVSFHPAGHVPGSAQIRVERAGEVWVVSGDYKTEARRPCRTLRAGPLPHLHLRMHLRPAGLPLAAAAAGHGPDQPTGGPPTPPQGTISILGAYALRQGAAHAWPALDPSIGPILTHGAVEAMTADPARAGLPPARHHPRHRRGHRENPSRRPRHRPALGPRRRAWANRFGPAATRPSPRAGWPCAASAAGAALGTRLRPVRPCRLARPERRDPRHRRRSASSSPMATPRPSAAGWRPKATTPASCETGGSSSPRSEASNDPRVPFSVPNILGGAGQTPPSSGHEALRRASSPPSTPPPRPRPRPRRWPTISARRPRPTGSGPSRFCRAAAPSAPSTPPNCGNGRPRRQACRSGCSRKAYPVVGDLAETIALILPPPASATTSASLSQHPRL